MTPHNIEDSHYQGFLNNTFPRLNSYYLYGHFIQTIYTSQNIGLFITPTDSFS